MREKIQQKSCCEKQGKTIDKRIISLAETENKNDTLSVYSKAEDEESKVECSSTGDDRTAERSKNIRAPGLNFAFPLICLIKFYKACISPILPPACRFTPTCSEYAMTALKRHGLIYGGCLMIYRILRCQPFCKGGCDPVPEKRTRETKKK